MARPRTWSGSLGILSAEDIEGWYELTFVSPYYAASLERFTRAELLFAAGEREAALGWYQGLEENTVAELVFLGPALLRQASIHRRAGRDDQARRLVARFEEAWAGADPEIKAAVLARYGG